MHGVACRLDHANVRIFPQRRPRGHDIRRCSSWTPDPCQLRIHVFGAQVYQGGGPVAKGWIDDIVLSTSRVGCGSQNTNPKPTDPKLPTTQAAANPTTRKSNPAPKPTDSPVLPAGGRLAGFGAHIEGVSVDPEGKYLYATHFRPESPSNDDGRNVIGRILVSDVVSRPARSGTKACPPTRASMA